MKSAIEQNLHEHDGVVISNNTSIPIATATPMGPRRATMEDAIKEWQDSGVSDAIIRANVEVIHGDEIIERLNLAERVGDKSGGYVTQGGARILSAYDSVIEFGGWFVAGLDPDSSYTEKMNWGKLKPVQPRPRVNRRGFNKYESCHGMTPRATFLEIPSRPDFWKVAEDDKRTDLYIAEGEKKAGCLLTLGHAAVSVSGIWNATQKNNNGVHHLIPDLKRFATKGRKIVFVYDSEGVPRKDATVYAALKTAGEAFQREGCDVRWVFWDSELGKGIDDVLSAHGPEKVQEILAKQRRLKTYEETLYCVNKSVEQHTFEQFFQGGKGEWSVIRDKYHRYTGQGYHQGIKDKAVLKALNLYHTKCFKRQGQEKDPVYNVATEKNKKNAFQWCRDTLYVDIDEGEGLDKRCLNMHLRCFKNGTLDMKTGELREHRKEDYLTSRIEADFIPGRPCPKTFENFVASSFGEENLPLVRAVISMFLDPTAPWGYFLYILGQSGGGKGTLSRFIKNLYDPASVRTVNSFDTIATPDNIHQYMTNTSLFCFSDVRGHIKGKGLSNFYEAVDNGPLAARPLFSNETYEARMYTRFIVASVEPVSIENAGDGWERRVIVLPVKSGNRKKDINLEKRLGLVKADVISWALSMPKDERNHILMNSASVSESAAEAKRAVTMTGDSVRQFIDLCLRPAPGGIEGASLSQIHSWYREFAKVFGYSDMGQSKLGARIQSIIPSAYEPRRKMKSGEPGYKPNTFVPAQYKMIDLPGVFEVSEATGALLIHKERVIEGGLDAFTPVDDHDIRQALIDCKNWADYCSIVGTYGKTSIDRIWNSLLTTEERNRITALAPETNTEPAPDKLESQALTEKEIEHFRTEIKKAVELQDMEYPVGIDDLSPDEKWLVWKDIPEDIQNRFLELKGCKW